MAVHCFRNRELAEELADRIGGLVVQGALRRPEEVAAVMDQAVAALGTVEVCVANSGGWDEEGVPVWEMFLDRFHRVVENNFVAPFLTCRDYLRHVQDTGVGSIVLVSSVSATFGEAGNADYAAAKSDVPYGFARTLKNEILRITPEDRVGRRPAAPRPKRRRWSRRSPRGH